MRNSHFGEHRVKTRMNTDGVLTWDEFIIRRPCYLLHISLTSTDANTYAENSKSCTQSIGSQHSRRGHTKLRSSFSWFACHTFLILLCRLNRIGNVIFTRPKTNPHRHLLASNGAPCCILRFRIMY